METPTWHLEGPRRDIGRLRRSLSGSNLKPTAAGLFSRIQRQIAWALRRPLIGYCLYIYIYIRCKCMMRSASITMPNVTSILQPLASESKYGLHGCTSTGYSAFKGSFTVIPGGSKYQIIKGRGLIKGYMVSIRWLFWVS